MTIIALQERLRTQYRSHDQRLRLSFSIPISRSPSRLTFAGLKRAIELYGSEPELIRSLRSLAPKYMAWKNHNAAPYRLWKQALEEEGLDFKFGASDGVSSTWAS